MERTLAKKKNNYKNSFFIFWDIFINFFILFVTFFQSCYFIFHTQEVAAHYKKQNKKRIMIMIKKQKSYSKSKNVKKIPKKLKIFNIRIHKGAGIQKTQTLYE